MQSHSSSLDTLKDNLLRAVDAESNVIKPAIVLDVICQLEKMTITKDQLQTTRLGREINTIRQKIDASKTNAQLNEIAHRAKKLLRSWQGLLNTSSADSSPPINPDSKPRLILKVKLNSPLNKRKRDPTSHKINVKRKKIQLIDTFVPLPTPISPVETNTSLPRLKTTQEILLEMQMHEPNVLATQTSTVNAILQKKIIDESLHETVKLDYSALHHGRDLHINNTNSQKQSSSLSNTGLPSARAPYPTSNWETSSTADSPISPLSSSCSSSLSATTIPEQSTPNSSDLATICASFHTVTDLIEDHRRRILAEHDSREIEARPDLLLVPLDQLAFVYEREKLRQIDSPPSHSQSSSMTTMEKLHQSSDFLALPFIDCPMEFDLVLDELIVQQSIINM